MAGTISFGGIGSNIDTEGIVTGLVSASSGPLSAMKSRAASTRAAVSTLSDIGSLLGKLKTAAEALADVQTSRSLKGTTTGTGVAVTVNGSASPGSYSIDVLALAKEYRSYTDGFSSSTNALGQSGTLNIKIGSADAVGIAINAGDSLNTLVDRINASGLRVGASLLFDGSEYKMQLRGLDSGNAAAVTVTGTTLGLTDVENFVQQAQDSHIKIDGISVKRSTNQVVGAIPGVTLALTAQTTTDPVKLSVDSDPEGLATKLRSMVDAYNAVIDKVHMTAGFGATKGPNPVLAGDSTLRAMTSRMSNVALSVVSGAGKFETLGSIGLSLGKDGKMSLDSAKLTAAIGSDAGSVSAVLAGVGSGNGVMDIVRDMVTGFTEPGKGLLEMREESLEGRAKALDDRVSREQERLDRYAEMLRKQFTAMDGVVAGNYSTLDYLTRIG
jgi:flagellar hook-associated protein 2